MYFKTTLLWMFFFALCLSGCKKWDEHTAATSQDLTKNLLDEISQRSNLSRFYEFLKQTGLDKELSNSKTYTVWAPTNDALQNLDPATLADPVKLKAFIGNHIALQTYFTRNAKQEVRVPMLNGKRVSFLNKKFDDANITEADRYVSNGVLHVIDKAAPVYQNAWELSQSTTNTYLQSAFIVSLTKKVFDPSHAIIDSINSITGQPIYRPGTDSSFRNAFNFEVADIQDESKQYTYFILNDAGFNTEVNKMIPYYKTSTTDSTKNLASFAVVKDLIVEGKYTIDQLPPVLVSKYGVNIPIDKSKIVETRRLSNGIAYVMSEINFLPKDKIPVVTVQGENYRAFYDNAGNIVTPRQNNVSAIFIRSRINKVTGQPFTDMYAYNHGISALSAQYRVFNLPSVKYKVYWLVPNDTLVVNLTAAPIAPVVFNQRLAMGVRGANFLPTTPATGMAVAINNYNEVYLGDYTQAAYGSLEMFLTANASTGAPTNNLNLDYIKLVPDL